MDGMLTRLLDRDAAKGADAPIPREPCQVCDQNADNAKRGIVGWRACPVHNRAARASTTGAETLLPCPFCGSAAVAYDDGEDCIACCNNSDCYHFPGVVSNKTVAEAIAKWNRRASPSKAEGEKPRQPDGYAYRYKSVLGDVIKFNHGEEYNLSKPVETIPYYFGTPPYAAPKPPEDAVIDPEWMRQHPEIEPPEDAAALVREIDRLTRGKTNADWRDLVALLDRCVVMLKPIAKPVLPENVTEMLREDAKLAAGLAESIRTAQYGIKFSDGSIRVGRQFFDREKNIVIRALESLARQSAQAASQPKGENDGQVKR